MNELMTAPVQPSRVVLGVTGSVAAVRVPSLYRALIDSGQRVRIVATEPSLYFFNPSDLPASEADPDRAYPDCEPGGPLFRDHNEWPGDRYQRDDAVRHIAFRNWADLLIVAPLDANTLAKFALGLADNFLACLFRAWDFGRPVVLAPAMNTLMWESPITRRHLAQILEDRAASPPPTAWSLDNAAEVFASHAPGIILIPPQSKRLACGDIGVGAMAEVATIAETVRRVLAQSPSY